MSIRPSWLSVQNFRALSCLEVELSKTWPYHGLNMALVWSLKLDTQEICLLSQVNSMKKVWFNSIKREERYYDLKLDVYKHTYKQTYKQTDLIPEVTPGWALNCVSISFASKDLTQNFPKLWPPNMVQNIVQIWLKIKKRMATRFGLRCNPKFSLKI